MRDRPGIWGKSVLIMIVCSMILAATACVKPTADPQSERVLRVMYAGFAGIGYENLIRQQYTDLFDFSNPDIRVEIVSDNYSDNYTDTSEAEPYNKASRLIHHMKEMLTMPNPPDIVIFNEGYLPLLADSQLLVDLQTLIRQSQFKVDDLSPKALDAITDRGGGGLYALAPYFNTTVLYYNKRLFELAGEPYPTDGMTWDELFALARRVARGQGKDRTYGLSLGEGDLFYNISAYSAALQLQLIDGGEMTVNTKQWANVWETFARLYADGIVTDSSSLRETDYSHWYDDLLSSRVAMVIGNAYKIDTILEANGNAAKGTGGEPLQWDVVSMPVHPSAPNVGGEVTFPELYAINVNAQNQKDAWEFIKFQMSEELAKLKSRSASLLLAREGAMSPKQGLDYHLKAFYLQKPAPYSKDRMNAFLMKGYYDLLSIGANRFADAISGKTSVEKALQSFQEEGTEWLSRVKGTDSGTIRVGE